MLDHQPINTLLTEQDEQTAFNDAEEARQRASNRERHYRSEVNSGNELFAALMQRAKKLYQRLDEQQLNRGQMFNSLADNIIVHQTNQHRNNQYDTNYYAGKVKEIETPEQIQELFNNKEADKYKIVIDMETQEVFS